MTQATAIGEQVRKWREAASLRQDQVAGAAQALGLPWTRATIAAIELGTREISLPEFLTIRGQAIQENELTGFFRRAATASGGDAEQKAARKLGVEPRVIVKTARRLWGRTLTEERDHRIKEWLGIGGVLQHVDTMRAKGARLRPTVSRRANLPRKVQAWRGHMTRALVVELQQALQGRKR